MGTWVLRGWPVPVARGCRRQSALRLGSWWDGHKGSMAQRTAMPASRWWDGQHLVSIYVLNAPIIECLLDKTTGTLGRELAEAYAAHECGLHGACRIEFQMAIDVMRLSCGDRCN